MTQPLPPADDSLAANGRRDLAQTTWGVLCIVALIGSTLWVLRPFLGAIIWAAMVTVATWPVFLWLEARLWRRRWLAVSVMVVFLLLVFVLPLTLAIATIVDNADEVIEWVRGLFAQGPPTLPQWVRNIPLVGSRLGSMWDDLVASGLGGIGERVLPYARGATTWLLAQAGLVGALMLQFLLTVVIAGVMFANGERAAEQMRRFGRRVGGLRGDHAMVLAGQAIRGVALGVGVTAIVQALLGGIGLAVAGVPFAALLTAVMFMFCIVQIGPTLVLLPATLWVFSNGDTGWGVFLAVWTAVVGTMDNFLRPILIKRGADLPLLLIFAGVIGGLLAFGVVGIFVGPVMLAVAYTLTDAWLQDVRLEPPADPDAVSLAPPPVAPVPVIPVAPMAADAPADVHRR